MLKPLVHKFCPDLSVRKNDIAKKQVHAKLKLILVRDDACFCASDTLLTAFSFLQSHPSPVLVSSALHLFWSPGPALRPVLNLYYRLRR